MCLIGLNLGTKYEVSIRKKIRDMAHCLDSGNFWTFDLDLLLGCTLIPSMKSVGQIGTEIWTYARIQTVKVKSSL